MPRVDRRGPVERPRCPGDHRQGQDSGHPAPVRELERRDHRDCEHRNGQRGCHDEPRAEPGAAVDAGWLTSRDLAGAGFRVLGGPDLGFVARGRDGRGDLFVGDIRRDGDVGGLEGQVDGGLDAVELSEFAFDPVDAGGAGHALNIEVNDAASGPAQQLFAVHGAFLFSLAALFTLLTGSSVAVSPVVARRAALGFAGHHEVPGLGDCLADLGG